ncbi:MAG: nucleic-acid-binding protein implicated in transcription termination [Peptococcaceae bacterium BRH_c4b]|nr:MAG: nucleic-acid-binding protein implicated in transcription termination [Peptococcaceae bacterium BRH_c4b]
MTVPRIKKIPLRMCVGCQEMKPKKELIRVVRTSQESVEIDPTGKRSGRGAYLCPQEECLKKAVKARRLEKALQRPIAQEIIDTLLREMKS